MTDKFESMDIFRERPFESLRIDGIARRYLMSDIAIERLKEVVAIVGSQRALSRIFCVSNSTVYHWVRNIATPTSKHIKMLTILTCGYIDYELLIYGIKPNRDVNIRDAIYYDFSKFIEKYYLEKMATKEKMTMEEYKEQRLPKRVKKILDKNEFNQSDIKNFKSCFGDSLEHWNCVRLVFREKFEFLY